MRNLYRFALIGCGQIGTRHIKQIQNYGILAAVCDVDFNKAKDWASRNTAVPYSSTEEMLKSEKDIDIAVVCTPNGLHATHAISSMQHGMHVLCEKPMAIAVKDAKEMLQTATQMNRKLFVVKQNRYNPPVVELKKILTENRLGKITSFQINCFWNRPKSYYQNTWRGTRVLDGGILFTQFSHFIDLLYWLLGDIKKVNGIGKNFLHQDCTQFEDTGVVYLEMQNGSIGSLHFTTNSFQSNMEGSITLFGETGTIKIGGQYLNVLEYQRIRDYDIRQLPVGKSANEYGFYTGSMSNHDKVYENLIKNLNGEENNSVMAEDGFKTVEIIEQIHAAIRTA